MATRKTEALKPKPRGKRPRCLDCKHELEPIFVEPTLPAKLNDGRRHKERDAWLKENPPKFTGNYGRFGNNRFCGVSCGFNWAVAHSKAPKV